MAQTWSRFLYFLAAAFIAAPVHGQGKSSDTWHQVALPFRAINVSSIGNTLWSCGTDESIASSEDGGNHWEVKHRVADGSILLNIEFVNTTFGYVAGTGGLLLMTQDGGQTWTPKPTLKETILQLSFSDSLHGVIRTEQSLLYTSDGGSKWKKVDAENYQLKDFQYPFSLAALDSRSMAIMLKQGPLQADAQTILSTEDAGATWQPTLIPNTTLYSFLRASKAYWAVGTEVVHKEQPGGGYGEPAAFISTTGSTWNHTDNDLSACKARTCTACTTRGCLSANGSLTNPFSERTSYATFAPNAALTTKWAATDRALCFVGHALQCTELKQSSLPTSASDLPLPAATSYGPLGSVSSTEPHCIDCRLNTLIVDSNIQGAFKITLSLQIGKNGTVSTVEANNCPSPKIRDTIKQQVGQWIFDPYVKDGLPADVKLKTPVNILVMKAR